jgi:hypothetical protein
MGSVWTRVLSKHPSRTDGFFRPKMVEQATEDDEHYRVIIMSTYENLEMCTYIKSMQHIDDAKVDAMCYIYLVPHLPIYFPIHILWFLLGFLRGAETKHPDLKYTTMREFKNT